MKDSKYKRMKLTNQTMVNLCKIYMHFKIAMK